MSIQILQTVFLVIIMVQISAVLWSIADGRKHQRAFEEQYYKRRNRRESKPKIKSVPVVKLGSQGVDDGK